MSKRITFEDELVLGHLTILSSARDMYVEECVKMAQEDPNIMFISAETMAPFGPLVDYLKENPERYVEVGIAEANQVGISAGLALSGKTVFMQGFGPFFALRTLDQIHTDIAYQNLKVRIINTHSGLTSGGGPTHYNIMDLSIMRTLPNMTVICPADAGQCLKAVRATENIPGPVSIRIARGAEPSVYTTQDYDFTVGKAITAVEGDDATIIAIGSTVPMAVSAANGLAKEGIHARVLDMHTLQPLDKEAVIKAAKETGKIVTAEDHLIVGGLGSAVAEVLMDEGLSGIKARRLGIPHDGFPPLGDMYELYKHLGYDPEGIKKAVKSLL